MRSWENETTMDRELVEPRQRMWQPTTSAWRCVVSKETEAMGKRSSGGLLYPRWSVKGCSKGPR